MFLRLCISASLGFPLLAQTPTIRIPIIASNPPEYCSSIPSITGAPFSAVELTQTIRASAPPTSETTSLARDSKGRSYCENSFVIVISDPVAHTRTVLHPSLDEATVLDRPDRVAPVGSANFHPLAGDEDLGLATIEGVTVHGYRRSTTIEFRPGMTGNDRPSTFKLEYWFSDQLQMSLKSQITDMNGQTKSVALTNLSLNEPEDALFRIPPGYKVTHAQNPIRIGPQVAEANLITRVEPDYPALAKSAGIQGVVTFEATIGPDGLIKNLQLVRGHPLLVSSARDALLQWEYKPVFLNGNPVAVVTSINVNIPSQSP